MCNEQAKRKHHVAKCMYVFEYIDVNNELLKFEFPEQGGGTFY